MDGDDAQWILAAGAGHNVPVGAKPDIVLTTDRQRTRASSTLGSSIEGEGRIMAVGKPVLVSAGGLLEQRHQVGRLVVANYANDAVWQGRTVRRRDAAVTAL